MSWEVVALIALALASGLFIWRESRIRRTGKLSKAQKALVLRLEALERSLASLPGEQVLAEFEAKLRELEAKTTDTAPVQLKVLVERVNNVSNDASALKILVDDLRNRFAKVEATTKWGKALSKEAASG